MTVDEKLKAWFQGFAPVTKGGPGSGNYGHAGRPGMRGGSMPHSSAMSLATGATAEIRRQETKALSALTPEWQSTEELAKRTGLSIGEVPRALATAELREEVESKTEGTKLSYRKGPKSKQDLEREQAERAEGAKKQYAVWHLGEAIKAARRDLSKYRDPEIRKIAQRNLDSLKQQQEDAQKGKFTPTMQRAIDNLEKNGWFK